MAINITIDGEDIDVLGEYRCRAILEALMAVADEECRLSYIMAASGAMRWPLGMRPEVLIQARCDVF